MKKSLKKSLALLLSILMVFSLFSATLTTVSAAERPSVLYMTPNSNWKQASARFAAYFFGNGDKWVDMTDSDGDGIYEVAVPEGYPSVIFCRMNPSTSSNNWDNRWNQTDDLSVPTNGTNWYTVKSGTWDKGGGTWGTFVVETEPESSDVEEDSSSEDDSSDVENPTDTPSEEGTETPEATEEPVSITVYCINSSNWDTVSAHAWITGGAGTAWPGLAMTNTGEVAPNGADIYEITLDVAYENIIFNNSDNGSQTPDLTLMEGQYYDVKSGAWYETLEEVPQLDTLATDRYLVGTFNGWSTVANEFKLDAEDSRTGYVSMELEAETTYEFKVVREGKWTSCATAITDTVGELTFSSSVSDNCSITTTEAGTYLFAFGLDSSRLAVVYPGDTIEDTIKPTVPTEPAPVRVVNFVNTANWDAVYAYVWTADYKVSWPGEACTLVEGTDNVYTYDATGYDNIIFNNGDNGIQTDEISAADANGMYYDPMTKTAYATAEEAIEAASGVVTYDYYVSGEAGLCGAEWDPSNADCGMTANDEGNYVKEFENIPAGEYKFKITDGSWNNSWGNGDDDDGNTVVTLLVSANVTITFDSTTEEIGVEIEYLEEVPTEDPNATEEETEPVPVDYYLFGYINGANYACEEDSDNMGEYQFVDGSLVATFESDSYVGVKTSNNGAWYMTQGYLGVVKEATLYNTTTELPEGIENFDKLYVPGGVEVTFTLTVNEDGTVKLVLDYEEPETEPSSSEDETEVPGETEEPVEGTVLYLAPNANWNEANARFAAYFFDNEAGINTWVDMTDTDADGIYEVIAPVEYSNVIFVRMNPETVDNDWANSWGQTADLTITSEYNQYTITEGSWSEGTWSVFGEELPTTEPVPVDYYLFGYINGANYACEEDSDNMGEYKFVDGTLVATFEVDSYVGVKTTNNGAWYMTEGYLGAAKEATLYNTTTTLPEGVNFDKLFVPGGVEVTFTLTVNEDGTVKLVLDYEEPETEPSSSEDEITDTPDETEVPGETEEPVEITVYCLNSLNWDTVNAHAWITDGAGTSWPGVAMTNTGTQASNGADIYEITFDVAYENIIFNNGNGNQTADLTLVEGQYYDLKTGAWYETLEDLPVVDKLATNRYLVGTFNSWDKADAEFKLDAEDSRTGYISLELEANTKYEFKVIREGAWTSCKTPITGTATELQFSSSVSDNATITTTIAGTYVFSFGLDSSRLAVTYPESPEDPDATENTDPTEDTTPVEETVLYLVPNANWKEAGARFAAYFFDNEAGINTWVDMTDLDADGIYEVVVPAGYVNVIFCRMNPGTTDNSWDSKWNQTGDLTITSEYNQYTMTEGSWDAGEWGVFGEVIPTDPTPADYYLFGYINNANYGCDEDYQNMGEYKFVDGTLTTTFEADSYVAVKTTNNANWYMFDAYVPGTTGILKNTSTGANEKMFVPGDATVVFTLVDNGDDTLTLSYEVIPTMLGDIDGDNEVSINDATQIQKYLARLTTLSAVQMANADVNGDGEITIRDVTYIQMYIVKLIDKFPGEIVPPVE